ncbi:MAG: transcription-repair coupling factor [Candidatus Thiodiazotropha sp.]
MPREPAQLFSPFKPKLPRAAEERLQWGGLHGCSAALAIANAASAYEGVLLVVTHDVQSATRLERELSFFLASEDLPVVNFPDWETLPYDLFSPLPELISQRLLTLYRLPQMQRGLLIAPVSTLMQRLAPQHFLDAHCLIIERGQRIDIDETRRRLEQGGYQCVSQVFSHGEFAVRGSLIDIFPMGSRLPYRIDLFDDEVDTIRTFDPENQRSHDKVSRIEMLPAREFPMDEAGINRFRRNYRARFEGDLQQSLIYQDVSDGRIPSGLEYYLPLFFEETATLFDYLPQRHMVIELAKVRDQAASFFAAVQERFEERRHDIERPLLPPRQLFLNADDLASHLNTGNSVTLSQHEIPSRSKGYADIVNFDTKLPPPVAFQARSRDPASALRRFLDDSPLRVLFIAEGAGRREMLLGTLRDLDIEPRVVEGWDGFLNSDIGIGLCVAPIEQGLWLDRPGIALITETQLYGERVRQERRRRKASQDPEQIVRNLTELHIGAPVVHEDHGVGRYRGLQTLDVGGMETEFLTLEYARGDKLYVPVSSLHLISRYAGASPENAPLHRLGGDQWEKTKRKAAKQIRDVAAELLEIYARRAARQGVAFPAPDDEYQAFAASFEFEETPDQMQTIDAVVEDMVTTQPMDRVVCGDVGFGKTEVAMRAAFMATQGNRQVAVLVPTTLLAQQHYQNFSDRFADWPVKVESLSRFRTGKQQQQVINGLGMGTVDIVVGTHKLLSREIKFKNLGLVIIDEEHRFGVRHKERLKALRSEVDLLTLTATPIPRTLNMAMSGMRDLSIIATPPALRHPVKTFVSQWNDSLIIEACQRELKRGGQIYFLHNEVDTIENMAQRLESLLPGIRLQIAHGQMRERELEGIMRDFYHQRFSLLVCTTIVESGIDVPSANTMIINRADKLGLAQLHQIRGRVGRSHHRAYAYLLTPPPGSMTADAKKRLEAIESLEDLGAGFTLSTHDLEIRGAGELLGEEQSGQIQEIGFSLYTELLERAVAALKAGRQPELDRPLDHGTEIELNIPALLPEDYLPDVHSRLVLYKRIASARDEGELRELQVEMIDRFGLLPDATKNLFAITGLKLRAHPLGIRKIEAGPKGARLLFEESPDLDPARLIGLIQSRPNTYKMDGGDRLRYLADLEAPERRVEKIHSLLDTLTA